MADNRGGALGRGRVLILEGCMLTIHFNIARSANVKMGKDYQGRWLI
jgi:hypothetical protein